MARKQVLQKRIKRKQPQKGKYYFKKANWLTVKEEEHEVKDYSGK